MLDCTRDWKASRSLTGGEAGGQLRNADIVLVKNDSGEDVPRFGVLGIDGVIFTADDNLLEFQARVAFTGITPAEADHAGKFVICLDPIADGKIGRAWVSGVCHVQVDFTDAGHKFCDVKGTDRTKLASSTTGSARILYRDGTGTGTKWCVVRMGDGEAGQSTVRLGQFTGNWCNEPGVSGADNVKLVKLYVQPPNSAGANDWVPELDSNGEEVIAVTLNLFSYIPTRSGNDSHMWCAVLPISDAAGEYWTGSYDNVEGVDVPIMRPYSKLWLLLAAEC